MAGLTLRFAFRPSDVIHVQYLPLLMRGLRLGVWSLRFGRRRGSRIVCTVHDSFPAGSGRPQWRRFHDVYRLADALICHSFTSKDQIIKEFGIPPSRIRVIPHGPLFAPTSPPDPAASRARLGLPPAACLVLCQGIVKPYKGVPYLLDFWDLLPDDSAAVLLIVGTGEEALLEDIHGRIALLRRPDSGRCNFRFISEQELSDYYDAADILVYPYREITTSGALLTGLARRKPVVATRCPAFLELLREGESALLVDYGDAGQLAARLTALIADVGQRARLAQSAASTLNQETSWDAIARKSCDCYHDVLRRRLA